jgi:hypothetical protein
MRTDDFPAGIVKIPADLDIQDRLMGRFTARQCLIIGISTALCWGWYMTTRHLLPLVVVTVTVIPVLAAGLALALVRRDGLYLDRLALAALAQRLRPRRLVHAPQGVPDLPSLLPTPLARKARPVPGPLRLPVIDIGEQGVLDLGAQGWAVLIACQPVSFALSTPAEQEAMVAAFARVLHSISTDIQILVRAQRMDLAPHLRRLRESSPELPHPALEEAALAHAGYLEELTSSADLLWRQILLVVRHPHADTDPGAGQDTGQDAGPDAGAAAVVRHAEQLARQLTSAGVAATVLDARAAHTILTSALNPHHTIGSIQ